MSIHSIRLGLGVLFLILGGLMFARAWFAPGLDDRFDPMRMNLGGAFALVFGCLNVARWYTAWCARRARATPVRTPLQPDPTAVRPETPNPDFDFTKPSDNKSDGSAT